MADKFGEFLGKAKIGFSKMGNSIADKTKELADRTNLNTDKVMLEKENQEHYIALGKMVVQRRKVDGEMEAIIAKIEENCKAIANLEAEMEEMKRSKEGKEQ